MSKRKGQDNLRVPTSEEAREYGAKGGKASGEARKKQKTIGNILKQWASFAVSDKQAEQLKKMGFSDDDLVNSTLVAVKLIQKIQGGDLKAMEMYVKLTGQDPEVQARVANTKQSTQLMKAEEKKIKSQFGDDREVENLAGLADMLKDDESSSDD